jgi:hypothetical protein
LVIPKGAETSAGRGWLEKIMKAAVVLWALVALCGVVLAIFATNAVLHVVGIVIGLVGVIASILSAARRRR